MDYIHQRALLSVMSCLKEKKKKGVQSLCDLDVSVWICAWVKKKKHHKNVLNSGSIFSDDKYWLSGG